MKTILMSDACELIGITRNALQQRMKRRGIKPVKFGHILEEDYRELRKARTIKEKPIIIYTPLRITETWHIYESRMNYDPSI